MDLVHTAMNIRFIKAYPSRVKRNTQIVSMSKRSKIKRITVDVEGKVVILYVVGSAVSSSMGDDDVTGIGSLSGSDDSRTSVKPGDGGMVFIKPAVEVNHREVFHEVVEVEFRCHVVSKHGR